MQSKRIDLNITTPIFPVPHSDDVHGIARRVSAITPVVNAALTPQPTPSPLHID